MGRALCVFGDSIAYGKSDAEGGGWASRLRRELDRRGGVELHNCAVSGNAAEDLLGRMGPECAARGCELLIVAVGINDAQCVGSRDAPRASREDFRERIEALAAMGRLSSRRTAFLGLTAVDEARTLPVGWNPEKFYLGARVALFDEELRAMCARRQLPYAPLLDALGPGQLADGVHPTSAGHEVLFLRILGFLDGIGFLE